MEVCDAVFAARFGETTPSADLGDKSKYSHETLHGRSGEAFYVKSVGHKLVDPSVVSHQ